MAPLRSTGVEPVCGGPIQTDVELFSAYPPKIEKTSQELQQAAGIWSAGKKLCWHTTFGDISIKESRCREGTKAVRPFAKSTQVSNRSCSRALQRAVTDFGADQPFAQALDKLVEHYGLVLGEGTIARMTQDHAKRIFETAPPAKSWPTQKDTSTAIIVQTDGGMVPIVDIDHRAMPHGGVYLVARFEPGIRC